MCLADQNGVVDRPFMAVEIPGGVNAGYPFNRLGFLVDAEVAPSAVLTEYIALSNRCFHGIAFSLVTGLAAAELCSYRLQDFISFLFFSVTDHSLQRQVVGL